MKGWPVTLTDSANRSRILAQLHLHDRALSGSGLLKGPHIIDPRGGTLRPVEDKAAAWSCGTTAAETDALSTAFMVMNAQEVEKYCLEHPDISAMVILKAQREQKQQIFRCGRW
jgi:thiamine biosynthesis lipoprotein ApbE